MRKSEAKSSGKAGRPPGPAPRPHIQVPGDELWPLGDIAAEFGISVRSLRRNPDVGITYIGGVGYAKNIATRKVYADSVKTPKQRRRGRR
jgi:hypothetical protein